MIDAAAEPSCPRRGPLTPRERREAAAASWKRPGGWYRETYREWHELPEVKALPARAWAIYQWGWQMSGGQWPVALPARASAGSLGICEQTFRRNVSVLLEAGLVEQLHAGGGAHENKNVFLFRCLTLGFKPRKWKGKEGPPVRCAPWARELRSVSSTAAAPVDADRDRRQDGVPLVPHPTPEPLDTAPPVPPDDDLYVRLAQARAEDSRLSAEDELEALRTFDLGTVWLLARHYGLADRTQPEPALEGVTADDLAVAMVRHFHREAGIRRRVDPRELALAREVVRHAGADAWRRYEDALRQLAQRVRAGRAERPLWFRYLEPYLARNGSLPPASAYDGDAWGRPPDDA